MGRRDLRGNRRACRAGGIRLTWSRERALGRGHGLQCGSRRTRRSAADSGQRQGPLLVPAGPRHLGRAEGGGGDGAPRGRAHALRPLQIWQGIDIETKMHVRFLNMETMALCH